MGKGIRMAGSGIHAQVLDDLKDQLIIVFLKRLKAAGQSLDFPVSEVDDTGQNTVSFSVDPITRNFHFEVGKKS